MNKLIKSLTVGVVFCWSSIGFATLNIGQTMKDEIDTQLTTATQEINNALSLLKEQLLEHLDAAPGLEKKY